MTEKHCWGQPNQDYLPARGSREHRKLFRHLLVCKSNVCCLSDLRFGRFDLGLGGPRSFTLRLQDLSSFAHQLRSFFKFCTRQFAAYPPAITPPPSSSPHPLSRSPSIRSFLSSLPLWGSGVPLGASRQVLWGTLAEASNTLWQLNWLGTFKSEQLVSSHGVRLHPLVDKREGHSCASIFGSRHPRLR